ncbi:MAG: AAA family ATPase [Actinobacteria bacterium]|nr:AAA family ATPase [Actinomycetota bacterium]
MAHDELAKEQELVTYAYECLDAMRERTRALEINAADEVTQKDLEMAIARRLASMDIGLRPLVFGRIDEAAGEVWYVGRRHVEDGNADPVVVEWRAPVAVPYYRASAADPMDLVRRRQFVADAQTLLSMADDVFDESAVDGDQPRVRGLDALLVELERSRTGEMLDIVSTIQVEQDEVIRSPQSGVLAVQGGPGTGKTAVGLHRAAYLLYGNDALARTGVLVVGPNRTFLRYIEHVLPSLGEEAVLQVTMADLVPRVRVTAVDPSDVLRAKGDASMAAVLRDALAAKRRSLDVDIDARAGVRTVRLGADEANGLGAQVATRRMPYASGRSTLRELLVKAMFDRSTADDPHAFGSLLRRDRAFVAALDRLWPSVTAAALVRGATGRTASRGWAEGDLPLLDEAEALLHGPGRTYGHIVVDEAQDLSPMQLRMLARRCPSGSMTILGDVAQGIGVWAIDSWDEAFAHLPTPAGSRTQELHMGYRSPAQVIDYAARLLPEAAPQVRPTESVRRGRTEPLVIAADDLAAAAVAEARRLSAEHGTVAVIAATSMVGDLTRALAHSGEGSGRLVGEDALGEAITVHAAPGVKGLEFDAVVVVEPAAIAEDAPRGLRLLYVALTRPTRHLTVVHRAPLPRTLEL